MGSDSLAESYVLKGIGECYLRYVPQLSVESAEVPVKDPTVSDCAVSQTSVVRNSADEVEDRLSGVDSQCVDAPASVRTQSDGSAGCLYTEVNQLREAECSPERVRRKGKKRGQCVSPYFRTGGGVVGSALPCAVRRNKWLPPRSPFGLIQEELYHDPFQLLVATILLNKTRGEAAVPVIWKLLGRWPTPEAVLEAVEEDMVSVIRPLGLHKKRAFIIKKFAEEFLRKQWTYPDELYGISKYGTDSYRIFCVEEWRDARPTDHMLLKYVKWLAEKQV